MQKTNELSICARLCYIRQQFKTERLEPPHLRFDIVDGESNMMDAFSPFGNKPADRTVLPCCLKQLNLAFTGPEKGGLHPLTLDGFGLIAGRI